ncbi:PPR domain-containing protein/PPR_2 domain-containing protein [Cephalotus follicularis]|uniref:PPR domain-containing protein/PPR_2 domain-containing protein n=1 Tax=Cephalotus follicularis TaxID=3775 RepID=A0A1Q3BWP8_CEPFO|nr:PPR domain-containing protein/PPR_2 domain-containing protein [Cephalotus follicularis]
MYSRSGVFCDGLKVFDEITDRNIFSWTLIISSAVHGGEFGLGLEMYLGMTRGGLVPNEFAIGSAMKGCASLGATEFGLCIHCFSFKIGIEKNLFVGSSILNFYAKMGDISAAERVFVCMDNVDIGCWNALIGGYAQCGYGFEAVNVLSTMLYEGIEMDNCTFINALQGCSVVGDLNIGRQIHGLIVRGEMGNYTSVMNVLTDMYIKNGGKRSALKVFGIMAANKDIVSWNTVFGGFCQNDCPKEVASLFNQFMLTGTKPNHITFSVLFRQCGELLDLNFGVQIHCLAIKFGFFDDIDVMSFLINMLSRCGAVEMARLAFDSIPSKSTVIWNELMSAYNLNSCEPEALGSFCSFWESGTAANEYTFSIALEACCKSGNQHMGRQIHGTIVKSGFASNGSVSSSLIRAYVNFGILDDSFKFFDGLERLDMAFWGAMISALVHQGYEYEAIRFLNSMLEAGEKPDEYIFGSILNGCAASAIYYHTKSIHAYIIKLGFDSHVFVVSAVIDAYAKCGDIKSAMMAFGQSYKSNDVIVFNTMIMAYAHHGLVMEAMGIFERMKLANLQPSQATFVAVISACSHMGLVDEGRFLFESMDLEYGMQPSPHIYGSLVDMLSRNGCLKDAKHVIEVMPFNPWPAILRSLLSGCRIHGNKELGKWAAEKLHQLVPENHATGILLAKVYSEMGSWEDAAKVKREMMGRIVPKNPGYSWMET